MSDTSTAAAPAKPAESKPADVKPAAKTAPADAKKANAGPLLAAQIWAREAGVKFNTWEAVPDAGVDAAQILRAEFWANVSQRMKPGDTLIVYPRDGGFYVELLVWDCGMNWATVQPKFEPMIRPELASAPGVAMDFDVRRDPIDGFVAVRKSNGQKLKGGFASAEDARKWFLDHQKALRH